MTRSQIGGPAASVSACLIAKDESKNLRRCLRSVKGAVDEIIVVDTGSTDDTAAIAAEEGARVFSFTWCDDFAAARNASLSHARGDWILWIDADDELQEPVPGSVRSICESLPKDYWGCWVDVNCPADSRAENETTVRQIRLFRNNIGVSFRGRIHEQPIPGPESGNKLAFSSDVVVQHWGYVPQGDLLEQKAERNQRLLRLCIAEEPHEPFHRYNLASQLAAAGDFSQALPEFERAIRLWSEQRGADDGYAAPMFSRAAYAAASLGQFDQVLEIERKTPAQFMSSELLYHAGVACWRLGRHEEAIKRFDRAQHDSSVINVNTHDRSTSTWRPLTMLACVLVDMDRLVDAYAAAQKAVTFASTQPEALFILAQLAAQLRKPAECIRWARQLLQGNRAGGYEAQARRLLLDIGTASADDPLILEALTGEVAGIPQEEAALLKAACFGRAGEPGLERELLETACGQFPDSIRLRAALARTLTSQGLIEEALRIMETGLSTASTDVRQALSA